MNEFDLTSLSWLGIFAVGVGAWLENEKRKREVATLHAVIDDLQTKLEIEKTRTDNIRSWIERQSEGTR